MHSSSVRPALEGAMHLLNNKSVLHTVPFGFLSVAGDEVIVHIKQANPQQVKNYI